MGVGSKVCVGSEVCVGAGVAVGNDVLVKAGAGAGVAVLCGAQAVNRIIVISRERKIVFILSSFAMETRW